jgi:hypothetical protein
MGGRSAAVNIETAAGKEAAFDLEMEAPAKVRLEV